MANYLEIRMESRRAKTRAWGDKLPADGRHAEYIPDPTKRDTGSTGSDNHDAKNTGNDRRAKKLCKELRQR